MLEGPPWSKQCWIIWTKCTVSKVFMWCLESGILYFIFSLGALTNDSSVRSTEKGSQNSDIHQSMKSKVRLDDRDPWASHKVTYMEQYSLHCKEKFPNIKWCQNVRKWTRFGKNWVLKWSVPAILEVLLLMRDSMQGQHVLSLLLLIRVRARIGHEIECLWKQ